MSEVPLYLCIALGGWNGKAASRVERISALLADKVWLIYQFQVDMLPRHVNRDMYRDRDLACRQGLLLHRSG